MLYYYLRLYLLDAKQQNHIYKPDTGDKIKITINTKDGYEISSNEKVGGRETFTLPTTYFVK